MVPISSGSGSRAVRVRVRLLRRVMLLACVLGLASSTFAQDAQPTVSFTPTAGTFVGRERVVLRAQGGAAVHFTLDGSLPTPASPIYRQPLVLDRSTRVRAVAVKDGSTGPVVTEAYLRVHPDAQRFTSNLPVILIHTFESGVLDPLGTEHVPAVLQAFEPASGTTRIVGRAALDTRIGIHVRGSSSRRFPKAQYAVELRADGEDDDRPRPLLGLPSGADWVLSDPLTYDRSLIRNALAFELSNRIGRYAPRTRFAEVFMVDDDGDVREGSFLGFFTLIEKIGRDAERVNVRRLPASSTSLPEMSGGFILRIDKGVPDFSAGGRWLQFVYPSPEVMQDPARSPQQDYISGFVTDFVRAASASDFRHPDTGRPYSDFIDVDAWIDHHIINVLTKNVDGLRFSAYFHKDRGGRLAAGPVWDFDRSLGTPYDLRVVEPEEWKAPTFNAADYFNEGWWRFLFRDPAFRAQYAARFKRLLEREFAPRNLDPLVDRMAADIAPAASRNFRRWADSPPQESHAAEIAVLKDFLHRRVAWIKKQLDVSF